MPLKSIKPNQIEWSVETAAMIYNLLAKSMDSPHLGNVSSIFNPWKISAAQI